MTKKLSVAYVLLHYDDDGNKEVDNVYLASSKEEAERQHSLEFECDGFCGRHELVGPFTPSMTVKGGVRLSLRLDRKTFVDRVDAIRERRQREKGSLLMKIDKLEKEKAAVRRRIEQIEEP